MFSHIRVLAVRKVGTRTFVHVPYTTAVEKSQVQAYYTCEYHNGRMAQFTGNHFFEGAGTIIDCEDFRWPLFWAFIKRVPFGIMDSKGRTVHKISKGEIVFGHFKLPEATGGSCIPYIFTVDEDVTMTDTSGVFVAKPSPGSVLISYHTDTEKDFHSPESWFSPDVLEQEFSTKVSTISVVEDDSPLGKMYRNYPLV